MDRESRLNMNGAVPAKRYSVSEGGEAGKRICRVAGRADVGMQKCLQPKTY